MTNTGGPTVVEPAGTAAEGEAGAGAGTDQGYQLGVDIGSTWTRATVRRGRETSPVLFPAPGGQGAVRPAMPSVVLAEASGALSVGVAAARGVSAAPGRAVDDVLLRLGDPTPIALGGRSYLPVELLAALLAEVVDVAADQQGDRPGTVVLSRPAVWGPYRSERFAEVPAAGGVGGASVVTGAELLAAHHGHRTAFAEGALLLVVDWGARSMECSTVQRIAGTWVVLGHADGVERLGGDDVDAALLALLDERAGGALVELAQGSPTERAVLQHAREEVRAAKERLSGHDAAQVSLPVPGRALTTVLTAADVEAAAEPLVRTALDAVARTLRSAGVEPGELSGALLVGGTCALPPVRRRVEEFLRCPVEVPRRPDEETAAAAAWWRSTASPGPERPGTAQDGALRTAPADGAAASVGGSGAGPPALPVPGDGAGAAGRPGRPSRRAVLMGTGAVVLAGTGTAVAVALAQRPQRPPGTRLTPSPSSTVPTSAAPSTPTAAPPQPSGDEAPSTRLVLTDVGRRPQGVALDPSGAVAWLACSVAQTISCIARPDGALLARLTSDLQPQYLAVGPGGRTVYATLLGEDSGAVAVIDGTSRRITSVIDVAPELHQPALSRDGRTLYVPSHRTSSLWTLDTVSGAVTELVAVPAAPHDVALSPDGSTAYVTGHESATVSMVDLVRGEVVSTVSQPSSPIAVAVSPDGTRVYAADYDGSLVTVFDRSLTRLRTVAVGTAPLSLVVAPDSQRVYLACSGTGELVTIDAGSAAVTSTVPIGAETWHVALSDDGRQAWVTSAAEDTVTVVQTVAGSAPLPGPASRTPLVARD